MITRTFTKKQWRKRKQREQDRLDRLTDEARDEGIRIGKEQGWEAMSDELAGVLFTLLAREPGQVTVTAIVEASLSQAAYLSARKKLPGGKYQYEAALRSVEP